MLYNRLDSLSLKFLPKEHEILRELKRIGLSRKPLLIAVSGGQDSIVLLHILTRLQPILKNTIYVAHIHHGAGTRVQVAYRKKAQKFVQTEAQKLGLKFLTNSLPSAKRLTSEASLRNYRYKELNKMSQKIEKQIAAKPIFVLAHHLDDQVETQLLRLIRGTGLEGFRGMDFFSEHKLRPLLICTKKEVAAMAKILKLKWCEDPSNVCEDPLRNWLRQRWLGLLEKKSPGARASLARSFSLIVSEASAHPELSSDLETQGLGRAQFLELGREQKSALIAQYLRQLKIHDYTQGQIEEIRRRLDNRRGEYTFTILKHEWRVDARRIQAIKL